MSLALGVLAAGAYGMARQTSLFAVERIEIRGAPPGVAAKVRRTLQPLAGQSLVALGHDDVTEPLERISGVATARYDRAFPHGLVVTVEGERPVAVLRRGPKSWLVSERGRVLRALPRPGRSRLPRIWVGGSTRIGTGTTVSARNVVTALGVSRALAAEGIGARVRAIGIRDEALVLLVGSGVEIRLGAPRDIPLKLAIARRVLHLAGPTAAYVDVSTPQRPVAGTNPQVEG